MMRRLWQLWTLFGIAGVCILLRIASLMLWHPVSTAQTTPAGGLRTAAARETMHLAQVDDGRGRILYRSGAVWRSDTTTSEDATIGMIGLPSHWPDAHRGVLEEGRSGLEYRFDSLLKQGRPRFLAQLMKEPQSVVYARSGRPGIDVRTTVDPALQQVAALALTHSQVEHGAVVLLDSHTNDILAMASTGGSRYQNPAVEPQTPGSVFKLVTAAAALDSLQAIADTVYHCDGAIHHPGVHLHCWRVHGKLNLVDAIAQSCDVAFGEIGNMMERSGLTVMVNRLHLTTTGLQRVNLQPVLPEAKAGHIFLRTGNDAGLLVNTAIGQEDVRISPLQGALLASSVADNGWYRDARLVLDVERSGRADHLFPTESKARAFSPYAALVIAQGMHDAAQTPLGTAAWLHKVSPLCAAKTGTAELPDGRVNGWLVGYWPQKHPQIAFSVFVGDTPTKLAHQQVRAVSTALLHGYRQFHPTTVIR